MYAKVREGAARVSGEGNDNGMHRALTKLRIMLVENYSFALPYRAVDFLGEYY